MMKAVKHTVAWILTAAFAAGLIFVFIAGQSKGEERVCNGIEIEISDSSKVGFVKEDEVKRFLEKEYGRITGILTDSLDIARIEALIDGRSAVQKSEAYVTADGKLRIKLTQRMPAIRFQTPQGGFYADDMGRVFPLQKNFSSHVMVVEGSLPLPADCGKADVALSDEQQQWIKDVMELDRYIESTSWHKTIAQIHVIRGGGLALIPRQGKELFILGKPDNLESKFARIEKYYSAIVPEKGEDFYRTVDLRYDGQIVCREK